MDVELIKQYRKKKGMTQNELAKEIGMRQNVLSNYETGKSSIEKMPIRDFMRLAAILGIPDEFIYLDKSRELDQKMAELEKNRAHEQELHKRKGKITKYLTDFSKKPTTEGECLALKRINAGYHAREMAFLLNIFPQAYNRYENNKLNIPYRIAVKIAYILGRKFEDIFGD